MPEEIHYMEEPRQCEFFPGCNYTVIFKHEHDPRDFVQKEITIPGEDSSSGLHLQTSLTIVDLSVGNTLSF